MTDLPTDPRRAATGHLPPGGADETPTPRPVEAPPPRLPRRAQPHPPPPRGGRRATTPTPATPTPAPCRHGARRMAAVGAARRRPDRETELPDLHREGRPATVEAADARSCAGPRPSPRRRAEAEVAQAPDRRLDARPGHPATGAGRRRRRRRAEAQAPSWRPGSWRRFRRRWATPAPRPAAGGGSGAVRARAAASVRRPDADPGGPAHRRRRPRRRRARGPARP